MRLTGAVVARRAAAAAGVIMAVVSAAPPAADAASPVAKGSAHGAAHAWPRCPRHKHPHDYPPRVCKAETDRTTVPPGQVVNVFGDGFEPHERVVVELLDVPAGHLMTAVANNDGAVVTAARVPTDATVGEHVLVLHGSASGNYLQTGIRIAPMAAVERAAARSDGRDGLPFSGAAAIPLTAGAVTMLLAGGVVLTMVRRRRRPTSLT